MTKREQLARAVLDVALFSKGLAERSCLQTEICKSPPCACADGIVDAILVELREPDEAMCDAGQVAWPADLRSQINDAESRAFWQAMIDAIE